MSKIVIEIETDNQAFADGNYPYEVQSILNKAAVKIQGAYSGGILRAGYSPTGNFKHRITLSDMLGNRVGAVMIHTDEVEEE